MISFLLKNLYNIPLHVYKESRDKRNDAFHPRLITGTQAFIQCVSGLETKGVNNLPWYHSNSSDSPMHSFFCNGNSRPKLESLPFTCANGLLLHPGCSKASSNPHVPALHRPAVLCTRFWILLLLFFAFTCKTTCYFNDLTGICQVGMHGFISSLRDIAGTVRFFSALPGFYRAFGISCFPC